MYIAFRATNNNSTPQNTGQPEDLMTTLGPTPFTVNVNIRYRRSKCWKSYLLNHKFHRKREKLHILFVFTVIAVGVLNTKFKYHFRLFELNETKRQSMKELSALQFLHIKKSMILKLRPPTLGTTICNQNNQRTYLEKIG